MELCTRFYVLIFGLILLLSCFFLFECKKVNGYKFPVYSTKHCPKNQAEWNERSSAINCTEDNGYVCLPNENITELLEFCYIYPFILIQEGICLYLSKRYSAVDSYSCIGFLNGCPNYSHVSSNMFKNPHCSSIGKGCFLAEPSCQSLTSTSDLQVATEHKSLENNGYWFLVGTTCGVFIIICLSVVGVLFINQRKEKRNYKRKKDAEMKEEEVPFVSQNQHNINESYTEESPIDQAVFKQWQEENELFVETKASKEVERLTKSQKIVIVTGHTGSGKSAIVHHVALKYRSQGWNIKNVCKVMDLIHIINSSTILEDKILFVQNDPIGKESFDEIEYTLWRRNEENLKACLNKLKVKFLLTCRKYILYDKKIKGLLKDRSNIVDISDDQNKLSTEEKENIWKRHAFDESVSRDELMKILQTDAYFPLLCKLYSSKTIKTTEKLRFFNAPVKRFQEEITDFRNSYPDKYCALVLLVLFNNVCVEDLIESPMSREKYEFALEMCEMKKTTAPHSIGDAFETLTGFFVKKVGGTYRFYHDFVMDVTSFLFGNDYPSHIIKYADIGFLRKRVKLKCCNDNNDQFTIYLYDRHIEALGKRLFNDIFGERLLDVVLNPCLKNEDVIKMFIKELDCHPDKLELLLEKKLLQIDRQEFDQTSNDLFLSKLVFVSLEERVSPLSAIIIFCDTRLSLHCLEALQKMPHNFKGNYLLSSVCCNGSKDVFAFFMKDYVKESLAEKWNFLYPIHIASAFNNKEILLELLQIGADVNLKTANENYWTPLTLAAGNDTDEIEENEMKTFHQLRRKDTLQLLLSNGADINSCIKNGASPLLIASQEGHDNIVQLLLSNGANINSSMEDGVSSLLVACQLGHENIVQLLLNHGADINLCTKDGASPIYVACQMGHENIVQLLLSNGADINLRIKDGSCPLYIACLEGHVTIVELLLKKGTDINSCTKSGTTPLITACKHGHDNIVRLLLINGADTNMCMEYGVSPLYIACEHGHDEIVQLLLNNGADINFCNEYGASPLYIGCEHGYDSIVDLLLRDGANINLYDAVGASPLHKACEHGHDKIVQLLLNNGAIINSCNECAASPLFIACRDGYDSIVQILLRKGADINSCNKYGASPLYIASQNGNDIIVQLLLRYGADKNSCNKFGTNALFVACEYGYDNIVQLLLSYGANINSCMKNGESALHIACKQGNCSIVQLLLSNGADINPCVKNETNPLYIACERGYDDIVQLLLEKGANINQCTKRGASPLYIAYEMKHESTVQLLLKNGADKHLRYIYGASPHHRTRYRHLNKEADTVV